MPTKEKMTNDFTYSPLHFFQDKGFSHHFLLRHPVGTFLPHFSLHNPRIFHQVIIIFIKNKVPVKITIRFLNLLIVLKLLARIIDRE